MKLETHEKDFLLINKEILSKLITKRLDDFKLASINAPTPEEREKARLLALELQYNQGFLEELARPKRGKKPKKDTGI